MNTRFVSVDRDQPLLLPPDLREWVPEDDLVHFVIQAVDGLDLSAFKVNVTGSGSAQYPPHMMLSLLVYCYANGVFSSRRIERATYRDIAVRFLTGDTHPDHDTIAKFRRENFEAVAACFVREMKEKMERDESRAKYRLRKQTVEPVFGTIKQWMGFRQFLLRGHAKVSGEWQLVTLAYNVKRLWGMQCAQTAAI